MRASDFLNKSSHNFTAEDLKELEGIKDLPTLKARAFELVSAPSQRPMKPEKVAWFKDAIDSKTNSRAIIKLMWDLFLSGEGHGVVGSQNSMGANSYRQRFNESKLAEEITATELDEVEKLVDSLWNKMGIDVTFTHHFLDRVNDTRNGKEITIEDLARLFIEEYKKYGLKVRELDDNDEAVFKDIATNINLPFVIKSHGYKSTLIAKTVMRKKNFGTSNPVFPVTTKEPVTEDNNNLSYIGNCTDDDVIEDIFGDATNFAQLVDEHGDDFELGDLIVKYNEDEDIHYFYEKIAGSNDFLEESELDQILNQLDSKPETQKQPSATAGIGSAIFKGVNDNLKRANGVTSHFQNLDPSQATNKAQAQPAMQPATTAEIKSAPPEVVNFVKGIARGKVATQGTGTPEVDNALKSLGLLR